MIVRKYAAHLTKKHPTLKMLTCALRRRRRCVKQEYLLRLDQVRTELFVIPKASLELTLLRTPPPVQALLPC